MIIMAIDLGEVRTGLAVCDKNEILASPLCTITEKNLNKLSNKVIEKISETDSELIILGLPLNMNGSYGQSAQKIIKFKEILSKKINVNIILWDERRTTISAINYLNELDIRNKKRKSIIDSLSASIILENYLNYRYNNITN